jgi:hypothetical protein
VLERFPFTAAPFTEAPSHLLANEAANTFTEARAWEVAERALQLDRATKERLWAMGKSARTLSVLLAEVEEQCERALLGCRRRLLSARVKPAGWKS